MTAPTRCGTLREQLTFHKWPEAEARAKALEILDAAEALAAELEQHGWGDFHYGNTGQDPKVVAALARWRELTGETDR